MSEVFSSIFGGKPKKPTVVRQPKKVEQNQADLERERVLKELSKRRRATLLSQLSEANIGRKQLGAG